jgi:hypothetical protein
MPKQAKPLGEKLREQADRKHRDAHARDLERKRIQDAADRAEAEERFADIVKDLPKRLRAAAKKGDTSLRVLQGGGDSVWMGRKYTSVESILSWKLEAWGKANGFDTHRTQYERDYEGPDTPDALTFTWAPKQRSGWV